MEYETLIAGMLLAKDMVVNELTTKKWLIVGYKSGDGRFPAKDPHLALYLAYEQSLVIGFKFFELIHVPREQNCQVELLSKLASLGNWGTIDRSYNKHSKQP